MSVYGYHTFSKLNCQQSINNNQLVVGKQNATRAMFASHAATSGYLRFLWLIP